MRTRHHAGFALLAALALVATLAVGSVTARGGRTFDLALSSAAEVPTPTDDATGTAVLTINPGHQEVCFEIGWDDVEGTIVAAHIHLAPTGVAGPVVVPLFIGPQTSDASGDGSTSGCVSSDLGSSELAAIIGHRSSYYVNVHSTVNPAGAIRAQLSD
ncbi:MAG: CHRD domain-containing protein [Candidatus Limnocylindria bacterium]